jgi:hypothetical protein
VAWLESISCEQKYTRHIQATWLALSSRLFCILRYRPGRWFVVKGWLASDDPVVLDHALHADNTPVDRGNPAIAVLSIGYQSLGSCSRAAGWSAATLCLGTNRTNRAGLTMSVLEGKADFPVAHPDFSD